MHVVEKIVPRIKQKTPFILSKNQYLFLMPLGDFHFGVDGFPTDHLMEHIEWGMSRGALFIGMGDYLDFMASSQQKIASSFRASTKDLLDKAASEQAQAFIKMMRMTKGRWIGFVKGNHGYTYQDGTCCDQEIAAGLGGEYYGTSLFARVGCKDLPQGAAVTIFAHHGKSGGQLMGSHLNALERTLGWQQADITLMGHSHGKKADTSDELGITADGAYYHRTRFVGRTGGWLLGYHKQDGKNQNAAASAFNGSYVEEFALRPVSLGGIAIGVGYKKIEGSKLCRPCIHYSI